MKTSLIRQPSAFVPLAMSLAGLALVLGHVAIFGVVRGADEGVAVRVFWLLMFGQAPVVAYFALRWLPRQPRQAWPILALQAGAWLAAWVPVYFLT